MNILILGSGGREHAFALKLSESKKINQLFVAPGNAGTSQVATNLAISATNFTAVKEAVLTNNIKMVVVGPEALLVEGVHDFFLADNDLKDIPVIGPKKEPTAKYESFTKESLAAGKEFLTTLEPPYVLKADGLAAGKGVLILNSLEEAQQEVPFADDAFLNKVEELVVKPTINGLQKDGIDYRGFIFIGLMNDNGNPSVVEYNVRMGDPETEVVLPRIESDLLELFEGVANQNLNEKSFKVTDKTATTVMLVSGGYPEAYEKGKEITGFNTVEDSIVFHAGTIEKEGKVVTNGGRVMAVTSFGDTINEALEKSYTSINKISFDKINFRKDIGFDL